MRITENAMMAMKNLRSNKVRSFLTMLGIIIGVGAVIAMVSLGDGAKNQITQKISEMGSNLLTVSPGRASENRFDNHTVEIIRDSSEYIDYVAPAVRGAKLVEGVESTFETSIIGCTPEYAAVRNYNVAYGRFLSNEENSSKRRVAVIGSYVAEKLFPEVNPIGEEIKVGKVRLEVVGVLAEKGQSGFGNGDNIIIMPLSTAQDRIFGSKALSEIAIQVKDVDYIDYTNNQVKEALLKEYQDEDSFNIFNMAEVLSTAQDMTKTMTMLLAGIAGVSLLVGGIGIMNIMLVSVTERIREIGIRKAIGAQPEEILTLFLIEAIILSIVGGIIGIGFGGSLALLIGKMIGWVMTISVSAVSIAFIFSVFIGLFFGVYPAYKASGLNPIEALRHE